MNSVIRRSAAAAQDTASSAEALSNGIEGIQELVADLVKIAGKRKMDGAT